MKTSAPSEIPRRIIQTAKSKNLSSPAKASAANLKLLHPTWDYQFFDDEAVVSFISREFPQYIPIFEGFRYKIQKFDFFRYLAVYRHGGFYFDTDVYLWSSLSPLLSSGMVFPFEEITLNRYLRDNLATDWEIGNYAFGACAGDPFLAAVIKNCIRAQRDPRWIEPMMRGIPRLFRADFEVLNSTGPGMLTRTLAENPELARRVNVLFPDDVRDEERWHHFGDYGVHMMEGSWRSHGGFLRRRMALYWEQCARKRMIGQSVLMGPSRTVRLDSLANA